MVGPEVQIAVSMNGFLVDDEVQVYSSLEVYLVHMYSNLCDRTIAGISQQEISGCFNPVMVIPFVV